MRKLQIQIDIADRADHYAVACEVESLLGRICVEDIEEVLGMFDGDALPLKDEGGKTVGTLGCESVDPVEGLLAAARAMQRADVTTAEIEEARDLLDAAIARAEKAEAARAPGVKVGDRVRVLQSKTVERSEIGEGLLGVVVHIGDDSICVEVDEPMSLLDPWHNQLVWMIDDVCDPQESTSSDPEVRAEWKRYTLGQLMLRYGIVEVYGNGQPAVGWQRRCAQRDEELADEALQIAGAHIQKALGVETGDFAGIYFTGDNGEEWEHTVQMFVKYIHAERAWNNGKRD